MHLFLEEEAISGDIIVCDRAGSEIVRFEGQEAMQAALHWAALQGLTVYSTLDPDDVHERHRSAIRRRLRLLRVRNTRSQPVRPDPPNVQRVIVEDDYYDDLFEGTEVILDVPDKPEVELVPDEEES